MSDIPKRRFLFVNHEDRRVWNTKGMRLSIDASPKLCSLRSFWKYDVDSLNTANSENNDFEFTFFDSLLDKSTAILAAEHDAVCIFVNDICDATVLQKLSALGVVRQKFYFPLR